MFNIVFPDDDGKFKDQLLNLKEMVENLTKGNPTGATDFTIIIHAENEKTP